MSPADQSGIAGSASCAMATIKPNRQATSPAAAQPDRRGARRQAKQATAAPRPNPQRPRSVAPGPKNDPAQTVLTLHSAAAAAITTPGRASTGSRRSSASSNGNSR